MLENIEKKDILFISLIILPFLYFVLPNLFQESIWSDEGLYIYEIEKFRQDPTFIFDKSIADLSFTILPIIYFSIIPLDPFHASRIGTLILGILGIIFAYFASKRLFEDDLLAISSTVIIAWNMRYLFFSIRSLTDIPISFAYILFLFTIFKKHEKRELKDYILISIAAFISLFTKIQGISVYLILAIDYLYVLYKHREKAIKVGVIYAIPLLLYFSWNLILYHRLFAATKKAISRTLIGKENIYLTQSNNIFGFAILWLALIGLFFSFKDVRFFENGIFFLFNLVFFSFVVGEKLPRYALPWIFSTAILAINAVYEILLYLFDKKYAKYITLLFALFVAINQIRYAPLLIQNYKDTYVGFIEAGKKIKELDKEYNFSAIYAASLRSIRAFSGIEYSNNGEKLKKLPSNYEELLNQTNIAIELDIWEYTAPKWAYPLNKQIVDLFTSNGFNVSFVVRDVKQYKNVPVIAILYR